MAPTPSNMARDGAPDPILRPHGDEEPSDGLNVADAMAEAGLLSAMEVGLRKGTHPDAPPDTATVSSDQAPSFGASPEPPRQLGPYLVFERLGAGAMGAVYKARHTGLDRLVALKVFCIEGPGQVDALKRFQREARILAQLDHPGIVRVLDMGEDQGEHYLAMELVDGQDLGRVLSRRPPTLEQTLAWMIVIAQAVGYVHRCNFIHRDLKPSNVLIDAEDRPRVGDFGLGRALGSGSHLTQTHQIMGTPHYMAPENLDPAHRGGLGPAADVYSLGVMLYQMGVGRLPFEADTALALYHKITETEPIPPRRVKPQLSASFERVCLKALRKRPADRYVDAGEFAQDLERLREGQSVLARPEAWRPLLGRRLRRHRLAVAVVGSLALAALGFGAVNLYLNHQRAVAADRERSRRLAEHLAEAQTQVAAKAWREAAEGYGRALVLAPDHPAARRGRLDAALSEARRLGGLHRYEEGQRFLEGIAQASAYLREDDDFRNEQAQLTAQAEGWSRKVQAAVGQFLTECEAESLRPDRDSVRADALAEGHRLQLLALKSPLMLELLLEQLAHPIEAVRCIAAQALGHMETIAALEPMLAQLAQDRVPRTRHALYEALARLAPRDARVRLAILGARGDPVEEHGMVPRAVLDLLDVTADDSTTYDAPAWLQRANYHILRGEARKAREAVDQALKLEPGRVNALIQLSYLQANAGQLEDAITTMQAVVDGLRDRPQDRKTLAEACVGLGAAQLQADRPDHAVATLDLAIKSDPENAFAYYNRAVAYGVKGNGPASRRDIDAAIKREPHRDAFYVLRAKLLAQEERWEAVIADYDRAIELNGEVADTYYLRGLSHLKTQQHGLALKDLRNACRLAPERAELHAARGIALELEGDPEEALSAHETALTLDAGQLDAIAGRARALNGLGRLEEARRAYDEAIRQRPLDVKLYLDRVHLVRAQKREQDALALLDDLLARFPAERLLALQFKAFVLEDAGRYPEALRAWDEVGDIALKVAGRHPPGWEVKRQALADRAQGRTGTPGQADFVQVAEEDLAPIRNLLAAGKAPEALAALAAILQLAPLHPETLALKGQALLLLGRTDEALDAFAQALASDPDQPLALRQRAAIRLSSGKTDLALLDLERLLKRNPKDVSALVNRGACYLLTGRFPEALKDFDDALRLEPERIDARHNRGAAWLALGRYDEALEEFNFVIARQANYLNAWINRGTIWQVKKEFQQAQADFQRADELAQGQNATVKQKLEEVRAALAESE